MDGAGRTANAEKPATVAEHHEHIVDHMGNLTYDNAEEEPELHARTYLALAGMWLLNYVQVFALQGPPAVVSHSRDATLDTS
jgi:hypothetical protein